MFTVTGDTLVMLHGVLVQRNVQRKELFDCSNVRYPTVANVSAMKLQYNPHNHSILVHTVLNIHVHINGPD